MVASGDWEVEEEEAECFYINYLEQYALNIRMCYLNETKTKDKNE